MDNARILEYDIRLCGNDGVGAVWAHRSVLAKRNGVLKRILSERAQTGVDEVNTDFDICYIDWEGLIVRAVVEFIYGKNEVPSFARFLESNARSKTKANKILSLAQAADYFALTGLALYAEKEMSNRYNLAPFLLDASYVQNCGVISNRARKIALGNIRAEPRIALTNKVVRSLPAFTLEALSIILELLLRSLHSFSLEAQYEILEELLWSLEKFPRKAQKVLLDKLQGTRQSHSAAVNKAKKRCSVIQAVGPSGRVASGLKKTSANRRSHTKDKGRCDITDSATVAEHQRPIALKNVDFSSTNITARAEGHDWAALCRALIEHHIRAVKAKASSLKLLNQTSTFVNDYNKSRKRKPPEAVQESHMATTAAFLADDDAKAESIPLLASRTSSEPEQESSPQPTDHYFPKEVAEQSSHPFEPSTNTEKPLAKPTSASSPRPKKRICGLQSLVESSSITPTSSSLGDVSSIIDSDANVPMKTNHPRRSKHRASAGVPWMTGSRVAVFWPDDNIFYDGVVQRVLPDECKIYVRYDDSEEEWVDLLATTVREGSPFPAEMNPHADNLQAGTRVSVFFPAERRHFDGTVLEIMEDNRKPHLVQFDDGDREWLNLYYREFSICPTTEAARGSPDEAKECIEKLCVELGNNAFTGRSFLEDQKLIVDIVIQMCKAQISDLVKRNSGQQREKDKIFVRRWEQTLPAFNTNVLSITLAYGAVGYRFISEKETSLSDLLQLLENQANGATRLKKNCRTNASKFLRHMIRYVIDHVVPRSLSVNEEDVMKTRLKQAMIELKKTEKRKTGYPMWSCDYFEELGEEKLDKEKHAYYLRGVCYDHALVLDRLIKGFSSVCSFEKSNLTERQKKARFSVNDGRRLFRDGGGRHVDSNLGA